MHSSGFCIYNQTKARSCYIIMSHIKILQNTFDTRTLNRLTNSIALASFDQSPQAVAKQIEQLSPKDYLWAVAKNPAYFVQYQVKSAAVLKVKNLILIVWRPKYIEYPALIKFPDLKDKKPANLKITIEEGSKTTAETNQALIQFIQSFYGTYFHSDPQFQTNLVTYSKHFISKVTRHSYWHALLDDSDQLFVTHLQDSTNMVKLRISGMKESYQKHLILFSYQGARNNFITTAKNKWMQIISFLAMLVIFYSVVACEADSTEGICAYRQEMTMGGAGIMLALIGLRYGQKKAKGKEAKRREKKKGGYVQINKKDE